MSASLSPPTANPSDRRPHQTGAASGSKSGAVVQASVEWLIDTGAQISVVTSNTGNQFDLTPTGGSAAATTGGVGILVKSGLTCKFEAEDSSGVTNTLTGSLDVGVKPNNSGGEILGMDQLNAAQVEVIWDPRYRSGKLREP
jgi:hypothetical protein